MTAVLVLQSMVMLAQVGLGIYGIMQVLRLQQAGEAYLCSDSINVFWVLIGLHFIQNTCVLGKLGKGHRAARGSGGPGGGRAAGGWAGWGRRAGFSFFAPARGLQHHPRGAEEDVDESD